MAAAESAITQQSAGASQAVSVVDDAGRTVSLSKPARRIISLIPSATESLIALDLADLIVGRSRYDVAPEISDRPLVGGTTDPSIETIASLKPDLVVSWQSDKRQQFMERLTKLGIPIFIMRTQDTSDVFRSLTSLGTLTAHDERARHVTDSLRALLAGIAQSVKSLPRPKVMYVVYSDPPMTAGPDSFIGQLISVAGGRSIFDDVRDNWPNVTMEEIMRRDPDIVIVPVGEFKEQELDRLRVTQGWRQLRAIRNGNVVAVPADLLSRPSPGIGMAAMLLRDAINRVR